MAQSVRITDELYELTQAVSAVTHRSLTQQLEHWARLGARLDLGLTGAQSVALLAEPQDAADLVERIRSLETAAASSPMLAARHAMLEAEVAAGTRDPSSLAVVPKDMAKAAKLSFPKKSFGRAKSW